MEILPPQEAVKIKKRRYLHLILTLMFILGNHNGYIALWESGDPTPKHVFPFSVASLPPADQEALHKGIAIDDRHALAQLLEDYLS